MKRCIAVLLLVLYLSLTVLGCEQKGVEPEEPTIAIISPMDGAVVYEIVEITADARDNKGIRKVEFYINDSIPDSSEAIDIQPPYSYLWNTLSLADSSTYTIYAKAHDTDDHVVGSRLITVMVNNALAIPLPVVLHDPSDITASSMTLTWTPNTNDDFQCYKIFRSLREGVGERSERIATIYDDSTSSYEVSDLVENRTYFFKVYVYDVFGFSAGSNEVEATGANIPPASVTLNDPGDIREDSMTLSWSRNEDHDFSSYKLFVLLTSGVDTLSTLVVEIEDRNMTTYTVTGLEPETPYFFKIFTYDSGGLATESNEIGWTTHSVFPDPVTLHSPHPITASSISLSWSQNTNHDFSSYKLFRSLTSGVDTLSTLVAEIHTRDLTTCADTNLDAETEYFYRVFVYDIDGWANGSNEVRGIPWPSEGETGDTITGELPGSATMEMVWIEPGTFVMGTTEEQRQWMISEGLWNDRMKNELPAHEVTISKGFWLGRYELTQAQWEDVMGTRPWAGYVQENASNPAVCISWEYVQAFIAKLNQAEGAEVYRLPTEAEWEYACRAGTTTRWSFGDDESRLKDYAWYEANAWSVGEQYAHAVGTKLPNPWGLYDLHGNVWEWVQDWYDANYYSVSPNVDPRGPASGSNCVGRGGGFLNDAQYTRSAYRRRDSPGMRYDGVGARLLRQGR